MGLFEFLMVLVSVVIGLGLTEILTGAANLLRARETVRFYWIHVLLQFGIFFALLQQWWESWEMHGVTEISFLAVMTLLASPVFLFLIAHLLYPPRSDDADLRDYYFRQSPLLWGLVVAGAFEGNFLSPFLLGQVVFEVGNLSGVPLVAVCMVLAMSRNARVHSVLAPLVLIIVILDTVLANPAISVQ